MLKFATLTATCALLAACASTPDVTHTYYLMKSNTTASVTQTVSCTNDKKALIISYSQPVMSIANVADYASPVDIHPQYVDSTFADTDFSLGLTDDGRLQSVNSTYTGQGETILKSVIGLGTAVAKLGGAEPATKGGAHTAAGSTLSVCAKIANWNSKDKSVNLVYSNIAKPADLGAPGTDGKSFPLDVAPDKTSQAIYGDLKAVPGFTDQLTLDAESHTTDMGGARFADCETHYKLCLTLQRTKNVRYAITANGSDLFYGNVAVPGTDAANDRYQIPVPPAAMFGTGKFAVTLNDTGNIKTLDYGKNSGDASVVNVAVTAATAATPAPPSK